MKRSMMIRQALIFTTILVILPIVAFFTARQYFAPPVTPTPIYDGQADEKREIEGAIREAIAKHQEEVLALLMYDTHIEGIRISEDGEWATAWISPVDPQSGEILPVEPGLVLLHQEEGAWAAILPSDPLWTLVIQQVPDDLVPAEEKVIWQQMAALRPSAAIRAPISGYYLPWAGGETKYLTQSVGHDRYTPSGSAHYAFDFATGGSPSGMFNIHAARGGRVSRAVWSNSNGDPEHANYLVLQDTSTSPVTYQLYLHLAKDSIPAELRIIGTPVRQGQFIGIADDTGVSSGNHLHFHVHSNSTSYWGTSLDITFTDVAINGGRPRITSDLPYCNSDDVCDTTQSAYVSQNFISPDHTPPTGGILSPALGTTVASSILHLEGWARDDNSGLATAQFIAKVDQSWQPIGSAFTTQSFSMDWDLCADRVPDGPVSLALELQDRALNRATNLPGLVHFTKNVDCPSPPPTCAPTANQAAIFGGTDYQAECVVLNVGSYATSATLGELGDNNADSIQVGANVQTTLFMGNNLQGRGETFFANDSNLSDNRIDRNTVSSVLVQTRGASPATPVLTWPASNATLADDASLSLAWRDAGGATQFKARLLLNGTETLSSAWQAETVWHVAPPTPGTYTWQVKARNGSVESSWSGTRTLVIQPPPSPAPVPPPALTPPFTITMETSEPAWTSLNWLLAQGDNHTPGGAYSWKYDVGSQTGYDTGSPNGGYLTSSPISLPAGSEFFLHFWYLYQTESAEVHWDQRWVQISVDGGAYTNLLQLVDDPPNFWLRSPTIALAPYAGHSIQLRFYFITLDSVLNNYRGWLVDDVAVTANPPPACQDDNNGFLQATLIGYGDRAEGVICPQGDVDYYKFQGIAGDQIGAHIEAQALGSALDSYLFLLDVDGRSVLEKNDDLVPYERPDSFLSYRLSRTGMYYLKLRAWDNPTAGGLNYPYALSLVRDNQDPTGSFIYPQSRMTIRPGLLTLQVSAQDAHSGISLVRFYWHSADWQSSSWNFLGEDWNGTDGWTYTFDTQTTSNLIGIAFYATIFDWAGNWIGTGAWNLKPPMIYLPLVRK